MLTLAQVSGTKLGRPAKRPVAQKNTAGEKNPVSTKSAADPASVTEPRIGSKLKHARLLQGYTLRELADNIGCSESMLSKLENDKLTPSISFLHRLANSLGTSIAELYSGSDDFSGPVHVFPADRRARIVEDPELFRKGAWFERFIPIDRSGLLQAHILNIPPGAKSDRPVTHVGEELGYLIEGEIEIIVDGKSYMVRQGDVIFFPSSLPHAYNNTSDKVVRMLKVNTPPSL
jgi:transcriptional regulator with XRE-family HTH domain